MNHPGIRPGMKMKEKVRSGKMTPEEALDIATKDICPSPYFIQWVKDTGKKRYKAARQAATEKTEKIEAEKKAKAASEPVDKALDKDKKAQKEKDKKTKKDKIK